MVGQQSSILTDVKDVAHWRISWEKNDVLSAEILWTLQTISAHYSYKSNENVRKIFQAMFPDSVIASKFACGEKKTAYLCTFGLAKHFKELLMDEVIDGLIVLQNVVTETI